jgi:hypothetical protein
VRRISRARASWGGLATDTMTHAACLARSSCDVSRGCSAPLPEFGL